VPKAFAESVEALIDGKIEGEMGIYVSIALHNTESATCVLRFRPRLLFFGFLHSVLLLDLIQVLPTVCW
jgi:hypothetical protein